LMQKCTGHLPSSVVFSSSFIERLDGAGLRVSEIKYRTPAATSCSSSVTPPCRELNQEPLEERPSDFFAMFATEVCFAILLPSAKKGAGQNLGKVALSRICCHTSSWPVRK
jgi:hypothetical protein